MDQCHRQRTGELFVSLLIIITTMRCTGIFLLEPATNTSELSRLKTTSSRENEVLLPIGTQEEPRSFSSPPFTSMSFEFIATP